MSSASASPASRVRLLLHGGEESSAGGPSVRVPRFATALRDLGLEARASVFRQDTEISEDIVHLFNVWPPDSALRSLRHLRKLGKRVVFSPIYLDFSLRPFWESSLPGFPMEDVSALAAEYARACAHADNRGRLHEIVPGYHAMVREMLDLADHVVFLSNAERQTLARIGAIVGEDRASLVYNPVDAEFWTKGDAALFRNEYLGHLPSGADYAVCVGRIEPRKNQLTIAHALQALPLHLALVGHDGDPAYTTRLRRVSGDRVTMPGRIAPGSATIRSAMAGARLFILASWAEGASLAALEAAAAGTNLVLSDRPSEREYFGDLARYCDPGDPESIRTAVAETLEDPDAEARAAALQARVRENFDWAAHAEATARVYRRVADAGPRRGPTRTPRRVAASNVVFELGLHREEQEPGCPAASAALALAQALRRASGNRPARLLVHDTAGRRFLDLPAGLPLDQAARFASRASGDLGLAAARLAPGTTMVVLGDRWKHDEAYLGALEDTKMQTGGALIAVLDDLTPLVRPDLSDGHGDRLRRLAALSDHLVLPSNEAARQAAAHLDHPAESTVLEFADLWPVTDPVGDAAALAGRLGDRHFALAVGPFAAQRNFDLLLQVWARFARSPLAPDLHLVVATSDPEHGIAERIARDPRLRGLVHVLTITNPTDIDWLMSRCMMVLCPSESEGWGWPVISALARQVPCLASTAPVLVEAAQGLAWHLDPDDTVSWAARIAALASDHHALQAQRMVIRDNYQAPVWSDVADALRALATESRKIDTARRLLAGEVAQACTGAHPLSLRFGNGWHPAEDWGRWAAEDTARIWLRGDGCLRPGLTALTTLLRLHMQIPEGETRCLRIIGNGIPLFEAPLTPRHLPTEIFLTLSASQFDEDGMLPMDLEFATSADPKSGPRDLPARRIGIGLVAAALLDPELSNPLAYVRHAEHWITDRTPKEVDFAIEAHRAALATGLDWHPAWGVGAQNTRFALFVPLMLGSGPWTLVIGLRPIASTRHPSGASFHWNGRLLGQYRWQDDTPAVITLTLTEDDVNRAAPGVLMVETESLMTPADLELGQCNTLVGLGIMDIALAPAPSTNAER